VQPQAIAADSLSIMAFEAARPDESTAFSPRPIAGPVRLTPGLFDASPSTPASLTYEPYYGLKEKAFSLSSDPRFLYKSPSHAPAFEELLNGIRRREGLIVLTGEIGTGKTTLIRSVLNHLDRRTFTAFVPDPFVSREDLLKMLLIDFGVVSVTDLKNGSLSGASRPDLSYPLYEFLDSLVPLQAFAVLIIDEAQNLPLPLLEEIRILSDLEHQEKLLQVVLVGQPELKSHLKLPEMRQVDQRVSVRCELSALSHEDVAVYIRHRLAVASGGDSRVDFSDDAIAAVFRGSGGVPRVINLICDRALQRGQAAGSARVERPLVLEAIRSLGLVPPIQVATTTGEAVATTVEVETRAHSVPVPAVNTPAAPLSISRGPDASRILSEFEAETDLVARRSKGNEWVWRAAAALVVTVLAIAGLSQVELTGLAGEIGQAPLPSSPEWTKARPAPTPANLDDLARGASPAQPAPSSRASAQGSDRYSIQVASFESPVRAERLVSELTAAGFRARSVELRLGGGAVFQIRIDGYRSADEANKDLTRIRERPGYNDARVIFN
jgi:general secretion pathway protein A